MECTIAPEASAGHHGPRSPPVYASAVLSAMGADAVWREGPLVPATIGSSHRRQQADGGRAGLPVEPSGARRCDPSRSRGAVRRRSAPSRGWALPRPGRGSPSDQRARGHVRRVRRDRGPDPARAAVRWKRQRLSQSREGAPRAEPVARLSGEDRVARRGCDPNRLQPGLPRRAPLPGRGIRIRTRRGSRLWGARPRPGPGRPRDAGAVWLLFRGPGRARGPHPRLPDERPDRYPRGALAARETIHVPRDGGAHAPDLRGGGIGVGLVPRWTTVRELLEWNYP